MLKRNSLLAAAGSLAAVVVAVGCGGSSRAKPATVARHVTAASAPATPPPPPPPPYPVVLPGAARQGLTGWRPVVDVRGQTAAWVKRIPAPGLPGDTVTLARFDQSLVTLALHAGAGDPGGTGWRYGDVIRPSEARRVVAAFNGGFKLSTGTGGFVSYGRVGAPLVTGNASVVTYRDGQTDVGAWNEGVPARGRSVASVRQTLNLLVNHGTAAADCGECWGATLHGAGTVARGALGVTRGGRLVWAGGEHLTAGALADALVGAGVVRAMELDINPQWVGGFLYRHHGESANVVPIELMPDQVLGPDMFVTPDTRDFFTVLANR